MSGGEYATIVVVGGGCYGSFYVRQLVRAKAAGALTWKRVLVVDRDPRCRVATLGRDAGVELVTEPWASFFDAYLSRACARPTDHEADAIVPSPLMPHLMYQWLASRARGRWPERRIATVPLASVPPTPWERAAPDGTHYVSFATWTCPVNCIEPGRCPHTRETRWWTMPEAMQQYVEAERQAGRPLAGPVIFQTTHRAYGVGMFDVAAAIEADRVVAAAGTQDDVDVLVSTVSHCHGAVNVLRVGGLRDDNE